MLSLIYPFHKSLGHAPFSYSAVLHRATTGPGPLGRPRRRWVDNIKMDNREIGWDGGDWIDLAQDRDQ
jgi:hypothetical protein